METAWLCPKATAQLSAALKLPYRSVCAVQTEVRQLLRLVSGLAEQIKSNVLHICGVV